MSFQSDGCIEPKGQEIRLRVENFSPVSQTIAVDIERLSRVLLSLLTSPKQRVTIMARRRVWRRVDMGLGLAFPFLPSGW